MLSGCHSIAAKQPMCVPTVLDKFRPRQMPPRCSVGNTTSVPGTGFEQSDSIAPSGMQRCANHQHHTCRWVRLYTLWEHVRDREKPSKDTETNANHTNQFTYTLRRIRILWHTIVEVDNTPPAPPKAFTFHPRAIIPLESTATTPLQVLCTMS